MKKITQNISKIDHTTIVLDRIGCGEDTSELNMECNISMETCNDRNAWFFTL